MNNILVVQLRHDKMNLMQILESGITHIHFVLAGQTLSYLASSFNAFTICKWVLFLPIIEYLLDHTSSRKYYCISLENR